MDTQADLKLLSSQMDLEPSEDFGSPAISEDCRNVVVYRAQMPNGKRIRLLKTLLSSVCENDCAYCPFRSGRDFRRASLQPEEFSRLVNNLYQAGIIDGVFVSSGVIGGGIRTQDRLLACAEILRSKHHFQGYLHLKIMPGAEFAQVERGMQLADRVSLNLEAPNPMRLLKLTSQKDFWKELWQPLEWVEKIRQNQPAQQGWKGRWPSSSTQFVLGSAGESDQELLLVTQSLYTQLKLQRAYFSPFTPHKDTPLENQAPTSYKREQRLYQASFLLRDYHFSAEEFSYEPDGNLALERDPKTTWAEQHLLHHPLEINKAQIEDLLRIPGIGPFSAKKIIKARREQTIKEMSYLSKLGIQVKRAEKFILINGRQPALQPRLW
jgi:predicted DNA-binding helix-hairpin-helix protein